MRWPSVQKGAVNLLLPVFLIYVVGLLMIFDASSGEIVDLSSEPFAKIETALYEDKAIDEDISSPIECRHFVSSVSSFAKGPSGKSPVSGFLRQLTWGIVATVALVIVVRVGWGAIFTYSSTLYWLSVVLLVVVFIPGIGICANGSHRWVGFRSVYLQPSEFVKIILPAYFIQQCSQDPSIYEKFSSFVRLLGKVCIAVALIALEPNNGTAGVIALMIGVLTLIMGIPCRFWLIPLCCIAAGLAFFAATSSHVQRRLTTYLHPEADLRGKGHQPYQAKIAAGSGGLFGKGPAKSMQKLSYLPEAQNDYIAAIFAEEFGFLGITILLSVYAWFLYEVMRIVSKVESTEAFCWGMSLLYLFSFQTFMNLGVVSGLLPSTGLNLPFFSQGGSSLVANFVGLGLIITMILPRRSRLSA